MSALIDEMTNRDPPRSRNTLDDDEEAEAAARKLDDCETLPKFCWEAEIPPEESVEMMIVMDGKAMTEFVMTACFEQDGLEKLGTFGKEKDVVLKMKGRNVIIVGCGRDLVSQDSCPAWAEGLFKRIKAEKIVVFGTIKNVDFVQTGVRREEAPLVRFLAANATSSQECETKLKLKPLESGNIITGIPAAVMTESVLNKVPIAYALLSLRDSYLEPETLLACVEPFISCIGGDTSSEQVKKIKEKASLIQESRMVDREALYL